MTIAGEVAIRWSPRRAHGFPPAVGPLEIGRRLRRACKAMARPLLGRVRSGPAILMYHRIATADYDPWGLAVRPDLFEQQVSWLTRKRLVLPLSEFAERHRRGDLPRSAVALTFDDGYACNAEVAAPLLERLGAPATIFLTTGVVAAGAEFWWDRLEHIVGELREEEIVVEFDGEILRHSLDPQPGLAPGGRREAAYHAIWALMRSLAPDLRAQLLDELAARAGLAQTPRPSHRPMNEDQVRRLAASPLISIGAHGVTHPALSELTPQARRAEIEDSCDACERLAGARPDVFAYPYGDYDVASVMAVRAAGFTTAVTTDDGFVRPDSDSLMLPRLQVGDWSPARLAGALEC